MIVLSYKFFLPSERILGSLVKVNRLLILIESFLAGQNLLGY